MATRDTIERILANTLDIGLVTLPVKQAGLRITPLRAEQLVAILPAATKRRCRPQALRARAVSFPVDTSIASMIGDVYCAKRTTPCLGSPVSSGLSAGSVGSGSFFVFIFDPQHHTA
jgi:hypothetical protein